MAHTMRVAHILVCHSVSPARLFASIPQDDAALWYVFLHGPSPEIAAQAKQFCEARDGRLFPYMRNRGLALSWNDAIADGMKEGCAAFLLLNDDLFFYDQAYRLFMEFVKKAADEEDDVAFVTAHGLESGASFSAGEVLRQDYACGAILRRSIDRIGYFDENFIPAYFEDVDYNARIMKSGMKRVVDERLLTEHERSSTRRLMSSRDARLLSEALTRNKSYITRKWGSDTSCHFDHPFGDPSLDLTIPEDRRHRPYGSYDIIPEVRANYVYRETA